VPGLDSYTNGSSGLCARPYGGGNEVYGGFLNLTFINCPTFLSSATAEYPVPATEGFAFDGGDFVCTQVVGKKRCQADPGCECTFSDEKQLRRHYWSHHRPWAEFVRIKKIDGICQGCGTIFRRKDYVKKHQKACPASRKRQGGLGKSASFYLRST
jgi:hypothetical protein